MFGLSLTRSQDGPARLVQPTVRLTLGAMLGLWLARRLTRLVVWLVRSPGALVTVVALVGLVVLVEQVGALHVGVGAGA